MKRRLTYDADVKPPGNWLELEESDKVRAIEAFHRAMSADHPPMPNFTLHCRLHLVLENQIALDDPPAVAQTVQRFMDQGLTRHEALHAIASVLMQHLSRLMHATDPQLANQRYAERVASFTVDQWLDGVDDKLGRPRRARRKPPPAG